MQTTVLGRTGLEVSVAGLGGGGHSRLGKSYGRSHDESVAVVRRAIDLGVSFIDTAAAYGTEEIVGDGIRASGETVVVSTKFSPYGKDGLVKGADVKRFAEKSLKRLRLETLDVYSLHGVVAEDYAYCRDELVPALLALRDQGKIRFPGITERFNSDPAHVMLGRALDDDVFDVVMVGFNLLNPSAARSILPRAKAAGVGTQIMFAVRRALSQPDALAEVVGGLVERGEVDGSGLDLERPFDFLLDAAGSVVEAAYRFCRHAPGADVILTGTGRVEHLEENLGFIQGDPLPASVLAQHEARFGAVDSVTGN
ncbi:MAG: aldo/keto reductase [Deltaproteobacteria bacterium]|nr:aldo/keto reductase [Deltaproteobacteria bacterium]MBW2414740.1 aldo/keto reductase [Deltaproteobacteria bacterium]